ncbi:hypothetical protein ACTG2S_15270 [Aeromonas sp. 82P]|uniref:hypothetical protein n=1 Tax=unclassified Aeromonas TaxID=257493 RepID=UPI003F797DA0
MSSELRKRLMQAGASVPYEWDVVPLEALLKDAKSISVGVMYPGPHTPGGTPLIKVGDIKGGLVTQKPEYCISSETDELHQRTRLHGDELLITLVGNPGECVVVEPCMAGWNPARAIAVIRLANPGWRIYLKAVLESAASKHLIDSVLNTTVQKTLNLKDIRQLPIPLPPEKVIQSLSDFSDVLSKRISLLRETNATLEAIAQALFKSWFVDFDPVHACARGEQPAGLAPEVAALFPDSFEESELGMVPKGWGVQPIRDVVEGVYDGPHATPPESNVGPVFLGIKNLTGTALDLSDVRHIADEDFIKWTKRVTPKAGDIVFSYEATLGFFALIPDEVKCCLGRRLALIRPMAIDGHGHFWFHQFVAAPFQRHLDKHTIQGATVNRIALKEFPSYPVLNPPSELKQAFEVRAAAIWHKIHLNQKQAQTLANLRDTLLPRLISGQLRLPDAEAQLSEVGLCQ